jgi:DNA-binding MarR family transcriptional regulator
VPGNEDEALTTREYEALAAFRYQIRQFLIFSEAAALREGLEPQQHQLLLTVKAFEEQGGPTIRTISEHLLIRHHSAVGLIDRLEARGLVTRVRREQDRRQVVIHLTPAGEEVLHRLASAHHEELRTSGPVLVNALAALLHG